MKAGKLISVNDLWAWCSWPLRSYENFLLLKNDIKNKELGQLSPEDTIIILDYDKKSEWVHAMSRFGPGWIKVRTPCTKIRII